jgi:hypothetical protein
MRRAVTAWALACLCLAMPAQAQESTVRMEATAGVAGYVDPSRPVTLAVEIAADLLFVGTLEVRMREATLRLPVEVPAGGAKTYPVTVPPPVAGSGVRLTLRPEGSDTAVANINVVLRTPIAELLVGIVGDPSLERVLRTVRTNPGEVPVTAAVISPSALDSDLDPLGYLVDAQPAAASSALESWIRSGGRLVVEEGRLASLELASEPGGPLVGVEAGLFRLGRGEVIAVPSLSGLDAAEWGRVLRPLPIHGTRREVWQSPEPSLMQAATGGGESTIPGLPWLLGALLLFALVVGPLNFAILSRIRRREMAWVTIPVLSLVAVAGFWLAGRQRLQAVSANHATVVVGTDSGLVARTALAMVTGAAGRQEMEVPDGWLVYPAQVFGFNAGFEGQPAQPATTAELNGNRLVFDLPQLGAGGAQAVWQPDDLPLPAISVRTGENGKIEVSATNPTTVDYWAFGVSGPAGTVVAPGGLAPGGNGTIETRIAQVAFQPFATSLADAVITAKNLWQDDPSGRGFQNLWALADAAAWSRLENRDEVFFFAFAESFEIPVEVGGRYPTVPGSALVILPVTLDPEQLAGIGTARAELIGVGDAAFVDEGPGYLAAQTDQMTIRFTIPTGVERGLEIGYIGGQGEQPAGLQAFDWESGEYVEVDLAASLDLRLVSPGGELIVKMLARQPLDATDPNFIPQMLSPYSLLLSWEVE